jgi:hypothetical protein
VELTPLVHTRDGGAFAETYFWQFQTLSVRTPRFSEPADGAVGESPVAPLFWTATDSAGLVEYRFAVSTDSAAIASGSAATMTAKLAQFVPDTRWGDGSTVYWKVHVKNLETGDEAEGPVWRFRVVPGDAPRDSIMLPIVDPGTFERGVWRCPVLASGPTNNAVFRIDPAPVSAGMVVRDAQLIFAPFTFVSPQTVTQAQPFVQALEVPWIACDGRYPGAAPVPSAGVLANGGMWDDGLIHYASDRLSAQVQGLIRRHDLHGFMPRSNRVLTFAPTAPTSGIRVVYYVQPTAANGGRHP